ncbi:hypothetical protein CSHISOI_11258 [Colletotrichum shisoi]|uniref:Uncharacterized protein n=1 Tax=Colletotrichum shisoi TaxID=2078593 RepID=A0A5Q4BBQ4_9PEZI|nr:hypothetical protein CSHISOI_11258 [Colletotrichum shisoi]
MKPTVKRVKQYTADYVYNNHVNKGYQIIKNNHNLIQFKNKQS